MATTLFESCADMFSILFFIAVAFVSGNRATRYDYYGGNSGCVVTGTKLFINGIYDHDLSSSEQTEFQQYQTAVKAYQQQQESIWEKLGNQVNHWLRKLRHNNASTTTQAPTTTITPPTPPSRPAFCNENATTQYYFDGCLVQNNKVYIGQTYARDLTSDEINQLITFIQQTEAYQEQLDYQEEQEELDYEEEQSNQQQGSHGVNIFSRPLSNRIQAATVNLSTTSAPATTTTTALQPPTQPSFCATIYVYETVDYSGNVQSTYYN